MRNSWIGITLTIAGFALCVAGVATAAEVELPVALTHAYVVTEPGNELDSVTILIRKGRIEAVGADVTIPSGSQIVDLEGMWVYPGFIDAASHLGVPDAPPSKEEIARITDVEVDPGEGPRTAMQRANRKGIWPHRTLADIYTPGANDSEAYRKAGFTTALITPRPAILSGTGDVVQLSGKPLRPSVLKSGITQMAAFGGEMNSTNEDRARYPVSRLGVVALLRQTYMDAEWYRERVNGAQSAGDLRRAPFDPVLEAMGPLLDREQTWTFLAQTADEIHHALDLADEFNQRIIILGGRDAWKVADRLAENNVAVIATPDWDEKPKFAPKDDESKKEIVYTTLSWSPKWENDFYEPLAARQERVREWVEQVNNMQTLLDAGVAVAVSGREAKDPADLWKKLRTAIEYGLTGEDVLRMLTTTPAAMYGVGDSIGKVASGYLANLVVTTLPLQDKDMEVRHTFVDGERFDFQVTLPAKDDEAEDAEKDAAGDAEESDEDDEEEDEEKKDEDTPTESTHRWTVERQADREPPRGTNGNVLLKGANVITVSGGTLPRTDVLVQNGDIAAIDRNLDAPAGTTVLDLHGYWIMPGIIDPHSHMAARAINEGSQSITCEVRIADVIDHTQLSLHRALAGGVTTIHTMHGSANSIGGQNAVMKLKYNTSPAEMHVTSGPRIVKFALGENVTRSRSLPRFPNTRMGVESVMRQAFNDALEYRKAFQRYAFDTAAGKIAELPRKDLRLDALNDILDGQIWVHSHCYRADEILRLLDVASDYGFRIATLQHVLEGYRVAPEMYAHGAGGSTFSDWWGYKQEAYNAIPYNAAMMLKQGIVASLNSDSANTVRYMNLEAAKTMRFGGLSAQEAIKLITLYPAIQIGLDDRIGSIDVGKDGDFAVYDRHPLDTFAKNVMTLIEGDVWFAHPSIDLKDIQPGPASAFEPTPPRAPLDIAASPDNFYAIVGGTVHPVASVPIENGVVVVRNGLISAVGQDFTPPEGATIIRAHGLHVYPGLIDAVSQLGLREIDAISVTVDSRDIAEFQPELRTLSAVNPFSAHIGVARAEGITATGVFPTGGTVSGRGGLVQLDGWSMPEMLRSAELGLIIDLPGLPARYDRDDRKKRLDEVREAVEQVERFVTESLAYAEAKGTESDIVVDVRLEAMIPYVTSDKPVFLRADSYKEILEAVNFAETFNFDPIIVGGGDAWKCAEMLAEKDIPVILTSVFNLPYDPMDPFDAYYTGPAKLEAAGVDFCIATDDSAYARRLPLHAGMAVAHGLSEEKAISSITLDAAEILRVDFELGSLEVGKVADVIITTGNPCQASTRTVAMFLAGVPTELTSLHEEHHETWSNRPRPDLEMLGELQGPPPMRLNEIDRPTIEKTP